MVLEPWPASPAGASGCDDLPTASSPCSWARLLELYSHDDSGWEGSLRTAGLAVAGFDPCVLASQQNDVWEQGDLNPHNVAVCGF